MRVFNAIEGKEKARYGGLTGDGLVKILERDQLLGAHDGNDALVSGGPGELRQLVARFLAHADAGLTAIGDEASEPLVVTFAGDDDVIKAAAPGLEGFLDGMEAVQNFHKGSLDCC